MESPIQLNLPISVSYSALEAVLQQQLVGMYIPQPDKGTEERPYAQVLEVGITGSRAGAYNVQLRVQLSILRTVLKRDKVDLYASVALAYDNATQQVYVQQFSMESATTSGFYNTALEVLVNKVAYGQIIEKARVDVGEIIGKEIQKVNAQLEQGLELKGMKLKGSVEAASVQGIAPKPDGLSLSVQLQGYMEVAIYDVSGFLPLLAGEV